jgi:hypothetical protein
MNKIEDILCLKVNDKLVINDKFICTITSNKKPFDVFYKNENGPFYNSCAYITIDGYENCIPHRINIQLNPLNENKLAGFIVIYDKYKPKSLVNITSVKII